MREKSPSYGFPISTLFLTGTLLSLGCTTSAQNYLTSTGTPSFSAPGPVENGFVENANGSLYLEFPLGSFPQRGSKKPLNIRFVYDSNIWQVIGSGTSLQWVPMNPGGNWQYVDETNSNVYEVNSGTGSQACLTDWNWVDAKRTPHYFHLNVQSPVGQSGCPTSASGYALDSSGYQLTISFYTTPTNYSTEQVYAPDGTLVYNFSNYYGNNGPFYAREDSNGNYLTGNGNVNLVDTLGRQLVKIASSCSSGATCYTVLNSTGGTSSYAVTYSQITTKTQFGQSGIAECFESCTVNVIQSIKLPDNSQYSFQYDCDSSTGNPACGSASGQSAYYGVMTSMTLPTGGTVTYSYMNFKDSYGNLSRWLYSRTRTTGSGYWTYSPAVITTCSAGGVGCKQSVTVNNSFYGSTVYTFTLNNGAWPTTTQYYSASGSLLRTVTTNWDFTNSCPLIGCTGAAYIRKTSELETLPMPGGSSITKKTQYSYDSAQTGNVTAILQWGYRAGTSPTFPSAADKAQYFSYLSTTHNNINRPTLITLCKNSGYFGDCNGTASMVSQTTIAYDSYGTNGLKSVQSIVSHDDTNFGTGFTARGNPTQIFQWVSGGTTLETQLSYDMTGQVSQKLDPALNPTNYYYTDAFFNDSGSNGVGTNPPGSYAAPATNAYLTSVTDAIGTQSYGYYFGSGKSAFSKDYNGETTYSHYLDSMDRQTETDYSIGWNLAAYTSETQFDSYVGVADLSPSTGCSSCRHVQDVFDTYGRNTAEKLVNNPAGTSNPTGPSEVDTSYDALGRIQTVTHPYIGTTDPNYVFESYAFDGMDRTIQVTHPDSQTAMTYYGSAVGSVTQQGSPSVYGYGYPAESVDESGKVRLTWIDGFNRVIEVDEPSQSSSTPGQGSVTISGSNTGTQIQYQCGQYNYCWRTAYDSGSVSITVNGFQVTENFYQGLNSTSSALATNLAGDLNAPGSPVTATVNGSVITLTSKIQGQQTNYSLSSTVWNSDTTDFPNCVYTATTSGATLTGGTGGITVSPYVTLYTYDAADRLTQVVQGVQTRTFVYDGQGRVTSRTTPEAGTDTLFYTTSSGSLCAGDPSALCRKTDARGTTTTYAYNSANQLTSKTYSDGTASVTYTYGQGGASAHALGRLTSMADGSGSETYSYGLMGRISHLTKVVGTTSYVIGYQYNGAGELTQITYPSGHVVQQSYDAVGRLCEIAPQTSGCGTASSPYSTGYSYNGANQPLTLKYGNGVVGSYSYAPTSAQVSTVSYVNGTQTYFSLNYYYQKDSSNCPNAPPASDGQIQCITDNVDSGRSVAYTYDMLNRISTAVTNGSAHFAQWGLSWSFDRYGNRLSQTVTAGTGPSNSLSFANPGGAQTNQPDGMCFDAAGNILSKIIKPCPSPTFSYDAENRMTTYMGTGGIYTYDGNGLRVKKVAMGTTTIIIYANGQDIAEYDNGAAPSSPSREFLYSGDDLLATLSGGKTTYHHKDHLSVRLLTDGTTGSPTYGQVLTQEGMYPYGESWYTTGSSSPDQFMFTTYARDSESGLDYALARFYDSGMGRFCSADPIQGRPDDPQSWNRYAYVRNNPVNITDPSGKFWEFLINFLIDFITSLFSTGGADAAFGFSLGQAADTTVIVTADAVTLSTAQAAVIGGLEAGAGAAASAAAGQMPASQQPQQQPNNQQNTQNCFKNQAFPQAFGPNANNIDTDSARQLLANNGSNIINGHRNWIFPAQFANQTQADAFRNVLNNNTFMPFGSRIDVTINGQVGWGLHVTHAAFDGLSATFRGHLDIGDPNRDVVGIVKHIKDDFFGGHKKEADLDPKCNP